jgi:large subunit ribosomal protein L21
MSIWAVIKTGGKQYKVAEGQTISVEKLGEENDAKITFDQILAVGGDKVEVGMPLVGKATVTGKLVENFKDKKIRIVKFKSKSKYLRINGHRQQKSRVLIEKIQA